MSLIRFLSSGSRGLTKGAPPMGRYRLPEGRLIPEFAARKNPFVTNHLPAQEETSPAAGVTARAASTQAAPPSPVSLETAHRVTWNRGVGALFTRLKRQGARTKPVAVRLIRAAGRLPRAFLSLLPFRRRPVPLASSVSPQPRGPVQGELSLENVRVVRNDLTDTDYEVVCTETSTASPVKRVPQTVSVPVQPRPLGRLVERLFSQKAP